MNLKALIIPAAIGIAGGIGVGTGIAFLRRPEPPAADVMHADSTAHADSLLADTGTHAAAAPDSAALPLTDSAQIAIALARQGDTLAAHVAPDSAAPAAKPAAAVPGGAQLAQADSAAAALARIFGAMKPAEAARVLQQLDDLSARRVIVQLSERKAAPILAALPQEKAAALAALLLQAKAHD